MRRISLWFATTAAVLGLLFNYRTSTMGSARPAPAVAADNAPGLVAGPTAPLAASGGSSQPRTSPSARSSSGPAAPPGAVSTSGSVLVANGMVASTQWGPVQVQVHISANRIVEVTALQVPDGFSRELSALAVPKLRAAVLAAQSADVDVVSGATQTSEGYRRSLQAALDSAQFVATR